MTPGYGRWISPVAALLLLLAAAGGAWVLRTFDPARGGLMPACRFHEMTGLQCPGCGITRATHHLLNGRVAQAFYFNAFYVATLPGLILWGAWWVRQWRSDRPFTRRAVKSNAWLAGSYLCAWLAFWLLRNLPGWPLL